MKVFVFYEHDSFLRRLNPLTKLFFTVLLMVALTAIVDPITPLVVLVLALLTTTTLGRVPLVSLLKALAPFVVLSLGLIWTTALFYVVPPGSHPRPIGTFGPFLVTDQALAYGLAIMFRMLGFFGTSLFFILTTDPTDFVQALIQQLHVSYRFGYGAHAAYGFVPLLDGELATIRAAHRVRSAGEGRGLLARARQYVRLMIPLLAGGVRRAERVALAMDARGFGAQPTRTYYRQSHFTSNDLRFAVGATLVLGAVGFALGRLGWLGQLVPPFWS